MATSMEREIENLSADVRGLSKGVRTLARREGSGDALRDRLRRARALVELATEAVGSAGDPSPAPGRGRGPLARMVGRLSGVTRADEARLKLATSIAAMRRRQAGAEGHVFKARSSTFSIPDFLGFLQVQGKTGLMELELARERIVLRVERGDVVDAYSDHSPPDCRLGAILVQRGAIDQATLDAFFLRHANQGERLGRALGAEALISERELAEALSEQALRIFERLHQAFDVPFTFRECPPIEEEPDVRLNVIELLLESARQVDESRRFLDEPPPALPSEASKLTEELTLDRKSVDAEPAG